MTTKADNEMKKTKKNAKLIKKRFYQQSTILNLCKWNNLLKYIKQINLLNVVVVSTHHLNKSVIALRKWLNKNQNKHISALIITWKLYKFRMMIFYSLIYLIPNKSIGINYFLYWVVRILEFLYVPT